MNRRRTSNEPKRLRISECGFRIGFFQIRNRQSAIRNDVVMGVRLLNVGFDNAVVAERVIAIVSADPSPIKRLRETALRHRKLVDATNGRRMRTVIMTDSDHVILSSLQPETVAQRLAELLDAPTRADEPAPGRSLASRG